MRAGPLRHAAILCASIGVGCLVLAAGCATSPGSGTAAVPADPIPTHPALSTFQECSACPVMIQLPGGSFQMGSPPTEAGRGPEEGPPHRVSLRSFAVARTEITFEHWDACVLDGGCEHRPGHRALCRGECPVVDVSWADATQYAAWLCRKTGAHYRLPSEAEWEYAARAGTSTPYPPVELKRGYLEALRRLRDSGAETLPVNLLPANPWGVTGMHGNAWEWVEDDPHSSYHGAPSDGSPWVDTPRSDLRIYRGGTWRWPDQGARSAERLHMLWRLRTRGLGFRVVRDAAAP